MSKKSEENDVYYIPANFIDTGTVFGGMLKLRNVIEAAVILVLAGLPIFNLGISFTAKIITACVTVLPLCLLALIGVAGESLSAFIISFIRFVKNRRMVGKDARQKRFTLMKKSIYRLVRQPMKKRERNDFDSEVPPEHSNEYLPVQKIENGIIYTKDKRYVKIIEIEPINFLLRSSREQKNIIYSFISYLKISPVRLQFKVVSKRADINRHLSHIRADIARETDEKCIELQKDYANLIRQIGSREAVTRRFFVIFEYESNYGNKRFTGESQAVAELNTAVHTARNYLLHCGNEVVTHDNEDEFLTDILYSVLNRRTRGVKTLEERMKEVAEKYRDNIENIPVAEYIKPDNIDFTHAKYVIIDGVYHTYLMIPSHGYRSQVMAGWTSLLVNAGEGIDLDIFMHKQPKDRLQQKLGQQLRINRSKIRETSDTNTDFDDLESAIRSGYFLKNGISNNEDFYYVNILLTITGDTADEVVYCSV